MDSHRKVTNQHDKHIILFDGVCNLCNGAVNTVIDADDQNKFLFSSLQSQVADNLLSEVAIDPKELDSIVLVTKDGQIYQKSDAALKVMTEIGGLWSLAVVFKVIPRWIRDRVYNVVAKNRYRWFGKQDECRLPTADLRRRFIDA